jgi:hypothetical protein
MAKKLKIYNGASWEDVTFAITPPNTAVTNSFTTNQVIDASTSVAALRVTQRGSGEAFRVEDDTNPDSSPFVINASGNVAIGSSSPQAMLHLERDSAGEIGAFIWNTNASGYAALRIGNSDRGTNGDHLIYGSSALGLRSKTGTHISFEPAGTERMRISSTGNVNIGPLPATGTGPLSINTNSSNSTVRMISLLNSRTYVGVDTGGVMIAGLANNGTVGTHDYGAIVFAARNGFADGGASTVSLLISNQRLPSNLNTRLGSVSTRMNVSPLCAVLGNCVPKLVDTGTPESAVNLKS